ncbi:MAG: GDSL-type esterase/lipase family protein [Acidimicrobiales bacterium]|nr:GDSL-type esterase/lipase family protein [Acidimicrobiales bacterium]
MRRIVLLVSVVLIAAACSDDGGGDGSPAPTTTVATTTPSTTAPPTTTAGDIGPVFIGGNDPAIALIGRWDTTDPTAPWAGWAGASITARFEGTGLGVHLAGNEVDELIRVVVDGDVLGAHRLLALANEAEDRIIPVVEDLDFGWHTVEVVKETRFADLTFRGLTVIGTGELETLPVSDRRIVFYGDSNLAGHSLISERDEPDPLLYGTYFGYAGITARMFGADFHNISWSGSRIAQVEAVFDAHDREAPDDAWDLSQFPADVVVMNLGANDIYGPTKDDVMADYLSMLDTLRAGHPNAHIVIYNAYGWAPAEPAGYTHELLDLWDDDNMSVASFPWVFEQFHGTEYDHGGMAMVLADHLEWVMGWDAAEQDVMSGFGRDGDLANGSFENVAPFGGWGWRYYNDPGITRHVGDGGAYDGDAYVTLSDGASIHQPTPIRPGQTLRVEGFSRVDEPGEMIVTIDFRNQTIYSDPINSESTFLPNDLKVDLEWVDFGVFAVAPDDENVWHARVTFTAGDGATVYLDAVTQTIS